MLSSFAVLAVAFVVRPFGGFFFGPLGDRIGRQKVLATTIILMSGSTFIIGVLPTYATIGIAAPILLILARMVQGFSTGGEYGGAATTIAEYAPAKRRGFFGSWLEFGTLTGYVLGSGLVLIMNVSLSSSAMDCLGLPDPVPDRAAAGLVGLYLRTRLEDTPAFRDMAKSGKSSRTPLREAISGNWRMILNLIGIVLLLNVADYTLLTFMPSYLTTYLKVGDTQRQIITISVEVAMMIVITFIGRLVGQDRAKTDPARLGHRLRRAELSGSAADGHRDGRGGIVVGFALLGALLVLILAVIGSTFPAMFPTKVRYGSFAIGYNLSTSAFGGTAPFVIAALIGATGNNLIPAYLPDHRGV